MPDVLKADITDYFEEGHTVEEFANLIKTVDDTEEICTGVQQNQKQSTCRKKAVTQKNEDEVTGGQVLVFRFLDCNYDENGSISCNSCICLYNRYFISYITSYLF